MGLLKTLGQWFLSFLLGWALDLYNSKKNKAAAEAKAKAERDQALLDQMERYKDAVTQEAKEQAFTDAIKRLDSK